MENRTILFNLGNDDPHMTKPFYMTAQSTNHIEQANNSVKAINIGLMGRKLWNSN